MQPPRRPRPRLRRASRSSTSPRRWPPARRSTPRSCASTASPRSFPPACSRSSTTCAIVYANDRLHEILGTQAAPVASPTSSTTVVTADRTKVVDAVARVLERRPATRTWRWTCASPPRASPAAACSASAPLEGPLGGAMSVIACVSDVTETPAPARRAGDGPHPPHVPRPPHRPGQPHPADQPHRRGHRPQPPDRRRRRPAARRRRRVQGRQRRPRPRRGRRPAPDRRRPPAGAGPAERPGGPRRRRRVRRAHGGLHRPRPPPPHGRADPRAVRPARRDRRAPAAHGRLRRHRHDHQQPRPRGAAARRRPGPAPGQDHRPAPLRDLRARDARGRRWPASSWSAASAGPSTDDQLLVVYQPIHDLTTGAVLSVEALLRWRHPEQRPRVAGRLHPPRRGHRPHRAHRPLGPRPGLRPGASWRPDPDGHAPEGQRQRVRPPAGVARPRRRRRRRAGPARACPPTG